MASNPWGLNPLPQPQLLPNRGKMIKCTFENGNHSLLRHAVADNLIVKDDRILLVKRAKRLNEGGKWALPGGFIDRDETVLEAAKGEAEEETGYKIASAQLLFFTDDPNRPGDDRQNISFIFKTEVLEKIRDIDDESKEINWFPLDNLPPQNQIAFDHYQLIKRFLNEK